MYHFPHRLAIAAIMKNEAPYIVEWLSYHRAAGVSKFYLYDNGSDDDTVDLVKPYIKKGLVELSICTLPAAQLQVYQDAIRRSWFNCKYLAVIDVDEFLLPLSGKFLPDEVEDTLLKFSESAGLAAPWRFFGSSGKAEYESDEVTYRFQHRAVDSFHANVQIKSIFNPRLAAYMTSPHSVHFYWKKHMVTGDGKPVVDNWITAEQLGNIFTYHYFVKSYGEFETKIRRGTADGTTVRPVSDFYSYDHNEVFDNRAWEYFKKKQALPYHIVSRELIDKNNDEFIGEIIEGKEVELDELLCHFFYAFSMKKKELWQIVSNLLLQRFIDDNPVKREDISLMVSCLPDLISTLRNGGMTLDEKWNEGIGRIVDSGIYEARRTYCTQELKEFLYVKDMLRLQMNR